MGTKIVTQPIIVGENETFEQDIFGRKDFGESLLHLVSISSDELVISLEGKWGEGKTTFVKMWQGLLNKEDIPNIYVNAFENDYSDDAFISIASAITAYIKEKKIKLVGFQEKAKEIGVQLLSLVTKVGINVVTSDAIRDDDFKKLHKIRSTIINDIVSEKLESHKKDVELIHSFKDLLSKISNTLNPNEDKPLVIIIDELDRCKPTYAVDIIEKVKHLFSVKNVVFVLVMNKEQLKESVKSIYGQNIDAHTYLQKFINIETTIPKRMDEQYCDSDIAQYNRRLFELHQIQTWGDPVLEYVEALATHFNLSLRQLERVYTTLAIFYATPAKNKLRTVPIMSFLAVIKVMDSSVYEALLYQRITYEELCEKTGLSLDNLKKQNERVLQDVITYLKYSIITDSEFSSLLQEGIAVDFRYSLNRYGMAREDLIPSLAKKLNMFTVA